ncbi:MAG: choice-of-anchor R domain-containing protein [Pirellulaceae bacterium]
MKTTLKQRASLTGTSLLLIFAFCPETRAQTAALYDNTHLQLHLGERLVHPHIAQRFAQPFRTDELHTHITSVDLPIGRVGLPEGEVLLSIWDDDNGTPGNLVGEVGLLMDLVDLPFIGPDAPSIEVTTFEPNLRNLEPNSTYYFVVDLTNLRSSNGIMNNVGNGAVFPSEGTNGARTLLAHTRGNTDWFNVGDVTGTSAFLQMSITASSAELLGDLDRNGILNAADIDLLAAELRNPTGDPVFDINGDGSTTSDDFLAWVHDSIIANTYFGDANLDGEFNSSDMTLVFSAAEYEDNITLNSTWAEGDWNGDGDFDSSDLILAFQDGGYEQGPRAGVQAVPEPASSTLWLLSLLSVVIPFRKNRNLRS